MKSVEKKQAVSLNKIIFKAVPHNLLGFSKSKGTQPAHTAHLLGSQEDQQLTLPEDWDPSHLLLGWLMVYKQVLSCSNISSPLTKARQVKHYPLITTRGTSPCGTQLEVRAKAAGESQSSTLMVEPGIVTHITKWEWSGGAKPTCRAGCSMISAANHSTLQNHTVLKCKDSLLVFYNTWQAT